MYSSVRRIVLIVLFVAAIQPVLRAQEEHSNHASAPSIPIELLKRPVGLRSGAGSVHEAVTTDSKQAQAFYDQGLTYLHSYVWIEAARSFYQALRYDSKLALAYVGLSRAFSGLGIGAAAVAAVEQAATRDNTAGPRERQRIALRVRQLDAMADPLNSMKFAAYKKVMDDALATDPADVELWLLRGNAEEADAGGHGLHGGASSIRFYEKALKLSPDHLAAHHYLVHSCENIGRIDEALGHAEAYVRLAPSVPHAHHMYGHDLRRVGRIEDAIAQFKRAEQLESEYYKTENIPSEFDWHHEHNVDLLATSYQYQGRMKVAEELMKKAFSVPSMQDTLEFNKKQWPGFLLLRDRPEEALAASKILTGSRWDIVRAIGHVMASHALLSLKRFPEAGEEAKAALREVQGSPSRTQFVAPYVEVLQGEFLLRTGKVESGRSVLTEVERKLRLEKGPDEWVQALFALEGIARIARAAGDWQLAAQTAREMLEHDPNYAGTHYALALIAEHGGDSATALKEFALAEKYWQKADSDLPELILVKSKLASGSKKES
jgi:tetratricopeptide (TPR) repeat protein